MNAFGNGAAFVVDLIVSPLSRIHPFLGLVGISLLTGILMLVVYKATSNQKGIHKVKSQIKAHFLAIALYRQSLRVLLSSAGGIVRENLRYIGLNLVPLMVMLVPIVILMVHLDHWYGYRAMRTGDKIAVSMKTEGSVNLRQDKVALQADPGVEVQTPPVRISRSGEVWWRIGAVREGEHTLAFKINDQTIKKSLVIGGGVHRLRLVRHKGGFTDSFIYPGAQTIDENMLVKKITVEYAPTLVKVGGWEIHWIYVFLILSIVFGLALKKPFGVEV